MFSNKLRGIGWRGHIYSECGRMVRCGLYHIQPIEGTVRHAHEELGHFGVKRTYSLFLGQYWWRSMHIDVQRLVSRCMVCDKVRASFNAPTPHLHPLPIMGLGYCWSLDFAGPLPLTVRHNIYVLVMVEHFSKWIELVPSPDKSNEGIAYAFLDRVFSHFGALAEVLTN